MDEKEITGKQIKTNMKILTFLSCLPVIALANFSYEGYKVYRFTLKTNEEATILPYLRENVNYDFFTEILALNHPIDVMVPPNSRKDFTDTLAARGIEYSVIDENVESKVKVERERLRRTSKIEKGRITFTEYHRYDVIQDYLYELALRYPSIVTVEQFGESLEGRPLTVIKIGTGSNSNPTILIESTIHAREWIAPAVTTYIIQQLVENSENRQFVENINWVIIPVLNPDGYEYSFTTERMWRKTRRPGEVCYGVDGNRNFNFQWGENGTSTNECSEIFIGPSPFSEPEVASFAVLTSQTNNIVLYLSMHSFGNWLLFPWGWTGQPIQNNDELQELGNAVSDAIWAVNGTRYISGSSVNLLYYAAGNSQDWVAFMGTPLSYTVELPAGPGGGLNGFVVPPERIIPVSEEFWPGVVTYANYVIQRWQRKGSP